MTLWNAVSHVVFWTWSTVNYENCEYQSKLPSLLVIKMDQFSVSVIMKNFIKQNYCFLKGNKNWYAFFISRLSTLVLKTTLKCSRNPSVVLETLWQYHAWFETESIIYLVFLISGSFYSQACMKQPPNLCYGLLSRPFCCFFTL